MTMNREMNVKCFRGGGAHLTSRRSCRSRVQRKSSSSSSSSNFFLGVRWRGVSWPTTLMQLGVLLILVNSIVLCSCSSISINSQSSSISKNTVLGAEDGHHEAFGESAGAAAGAPPTTMSPTPTTSTTTTASGNGVMTTTTPTTTIKSKGSTATDSSAEARRKEKKGSFSNDTSGKGAGVRINVSNNTTAPLVTVPSKPKSGGGGGAGKEYWNKQQKVASVLKGSKKGKYRFDAKLGRMRERELFLAGHLFGWNRFVDLLLLSGRRAFGWFIVPTAIPRDLLSAAWLFVW